MAKPEPSPGGRKVLFHSRFNFNSATLGSFTRPLLKFTCLAQSHCRPQALPRYCTWNRFQNEAPETRENSIFQGQNSGYWTDLEWSNYLGRRGAAAGGVSPWLSFRKHDFQWEGSEWLNSLFFCISWHPLTWTLWREGPWAAGKSHDYSGRLGQILHGYTVSTLSLLT